jgi:hypothetical protein
VVVVLCSVSSTLRDTEIGATRSVVKLVLDGSTAAARSQSEAYPDDPEGRHLHSDPVVFLNRPGHFPFPLSSSAPGKDYLSLPAAGSSFVRSNTSMVASGLGIIPP